METKINSYPSIYNLGHAAIRELFLDTVEVQEKIDGSQFSVMKLSGELYARSKGKQLVVDAPEKMFIKAIESAKELDLHDGWLYRTEFLSKPKHNVLAYDRVPNKNLIIFDINTGLETYLPYCEMKVEAERLGLEVVPLIFSGMISNVESLMSFLETISILGGQKIEGMVFKNYSRFGKDKKVLMGKFVSEKFKEVHGSERKKANSGRKDLVQSLILKYKTEARWNKAVQHLRERGELQDCLKDIGNLLKEVHLDLEKECKEEISEALYKHFMPHIKRGAAAGLPIWYKELMLKKQFEK